MSDKELLWQGIGEKFHKDMEESKNSTGQRKATAASLYEEA